MAVIAKTKNILFFLLTSKKIAEALGEQQAATVDCISSLQYLKIICPAFFPPCGPDSVCVCVCVYMCTSTSLGLCSQSALQKLGQWADVILLEMLQAGISMTVFKPVSAVLSLLEILIGKVFFFLTLPSLSYIRLLATVLLGSFNVMKWWVDQRRKKGNACCGKLCCCCSFLSSHWDVITSWRKLECLKNESQCRVGEGGDGRRIQ